MTSRRTIAIWLAPLAFVVGACVVDGPVGARVGGAYFAATCNIVPGSALGDEIADVSASRLGVLKAREIQGVPTQDAVAVLTPEIDCGHDRDRWQLWHDDSLSSKQIDQIISTLEVD